ncbi:DNA-binding MarR family transcriptional regulator [Rhodococcus sp. OK519]|uniref:MarR family winged helix-turn-helix transcriptional regulator n=1 Tax=Rhodococcus sp. OK519 TaxID=2135729 RepID=UPI000D3F3D15|nr:DNA-binding MarR family transcriptional regulator [Rhodococcus sp. OK519]
MERHLIYELHSLTARMDRSADRLLMAECGLSYRRFLALLMLGELGTATQRALAERMGVTEPSVSRTVGVLAEAGLLDLRPDPAGGNRRQLALTADGKELVEKGQQLLELRFEQLIARSGVPYAVYAEHTRLLLEALEALDVSVQKR